MAKGILGKKLGMTQIFNAEGLLIPVTVIEAGPCTVVQKKTLEKDQYLAVQLGFGERRERLVNKPEAGHFAKAKVKPKRYLREIRFNSDEDFAQLSVGDTVDVSIFQEGEKVDVTATSKGKGFQGSIKRHNQSRGRMSHGSKYHRRVGSLGSIAPARVFKGRPLPGRMGGERVTIQNLEIVKVDPDRNLLLVKGSVPGVKGSLVIIRSAVKG
ncbi:MAG: 50S ribosomal protein L3 [Limnochordia bacterium]|jgi:large subunit ribosomal protein L3|nr:50S ribosomal protein L3 [Limnochordia bacterium]MDI9465979.1 50S ribosomal protein L3 [Bacillota bacterium]NLO95579.1 50S ribosomal protein L3 [Bacillota bacterium]HAN95860.1 50S ribosomal protein L3 [Bacillota bacterium]HOB40592.1 50S ribosomal protein L3 [Limnochordia bacterium]